MTFRDALKKHREPQGKASAAADTAQTTQTAAPGSSGGSGSGLSFRDALNKYREQQATISLDGWVNSSIALINEVQNSSGNWYDDNEYQSRYDRFTSLLSQADSWRKQYGGNADAASYIDSVVAALTEAKNYSHNYRQYYSQWETADAYNKWMQYSTPEGRQEQYEKNQARLKELKGQRDVVYRNSARYQPGMNPYAAGVEPLTMSSYSPGYGAAQQGVKSATSEMDKEIAALEKEIRLYEYGEADADGFYYGFKTADDYGKYLQDDKFRAAAMNREYRNADRAELDAYDQSLSEGSLAMSNGGYFDEAGNVRNARGEIVQYAAAPEVQDKLGMFLSATDKDIEEAYNILSASNGNYETTWADIMQEGDTKRWRYLKDDELQIYYGLLKTEGQEAAYRYLEAMEVELGRREQKEVYTYVEGTSGLEQIMLNAASVPMNMLGGIAATVDTASRLIQGKDLNPYSRAQSLTSTGNYIRYNTAQEIDDATGGMAIPGLDFSFGDAYQAGMSMVDSLVGARFGGKAYQAVMSMGAASTEMAKLYSQGASTEQMVLAGVAAGAAEWVFEKYSIENLISLKSPETLGQFLKNAFIQGGIEMSEEAATELANILSNGLIMQNESDWAKVLEENGGDYRKAVTEMAIQIANAGLGGFLSGFGSGFIQQGMQYGAQQQENKELGQYISGAKSTDALVALAQEMAGAASGKDQKRLISQSDRIGKEFLTKGGKDRAIGRLYNTVRSVVTEQNISEISSALQEKGFSKKDAAAIAGAVAVQINGMELTDNQQKTLKKFENNETVRAVVDEILDNGESGINQRAKSVAKFEFGAMRNHIISRMEQSLAEQENVHNGDKVDTAEKNGAESRYEVSADGKTIIKASGESVNVQEVADIKDGKMTLRLDDGRTVNAEDVSFGSAGEALIYDTVAQMGASVKAANVLVRQFKAAEGMDAEVFSNGIQEAFRYGKLGIPAGELSKASFASKLNPGQQEYVYRQGQRAAGKQVAKEQATVSKMSAVGDKNAPTERDSRSYKATLENGISVTSLSPSQKASYQLADQIAEAAKVNIRVYVGKAGEHGYYKYQTDEIWLNLNAANKSQKSMMAFTLGHELVHRAKKGSPAKYKQFANFLMEQYGKQDSDIETMIGEELAAAEEFGVEMTYEQAFEEVVCDACQRMLLDTDAGQKLAEFGAQSKQNKSFLEDLKRWITEFMEKLRSIFAGVEPDSLAAQEFAKFDADVKQILADMYVDMTIDAGENLSVIQNAFGKGTVVQANAQGEFTMASSRDGSKKVFNLVTWNNGGRETLEATLLREGYTEEEVKAALTIMDEKHRLVESIAKEVDENGKMTFPEQGRINEATLTTDLKDGHSVLSALVSNGDYPVNIDLLMVCKKRKAYQRVINRLCETGLIQQATVDALAIAEINKILGKHGFETACLGCFVESRRLRIQEWAQTICKEWNAEVKKRNPNAKAFGFGKGEATLTPDEVMKIIGELESGGEKNEQGNLNLGQGSAVKRMGVLLDKVPSLGRTLSIEDLITPAGLSSLRSFDSNLFSMVKSRYGSNSPKFVQEFNPYNHELAKYGKVPSEYKSLREYLYAIGGARMQSFSDFIIENWFDYCQIVADLAARKLPMHTYTKEIALAKLFGLTGIKINMSLIPDVDRNLPREFAGLTRNANGELELIWADKDRHKATSGKSYMQSINFADAVALQNDPRYSANIGTIAVGISDKHIQMMLDDARIRMIIPYHSSGMNPIFADMMGTSYYKDYTNFQNTTIRQMYNSKGQKVSLKLDKTQTGKLTSGFQFNEVLQEMGDARVAAEAYKEWCADASKHTITIKGETYTAELTPKFDDFSGHENYYKLLEDFNTYDCISEHAAPQGDVQQIYPEGFEDILRAELTGQEKYRQKQEQNQAFDKAMGEIEEYLNNHSKADTVYYAKQRGIKLGDKDKKLDAAEKAKLKKLQEEGASFSLPKSELAPTFYSHMARVVDGVKQEKLGAASVVSMLRGKGVKAEEIKWSGIEAWLEGKKSVTKAELQEFIAGSMLQIEEEMLTDQEIPYSQEHLEQIAKFEAERDIIAENLKSEWKRIVGTDIPITHFGAGLEHALVNNLLEANATIKGNTEAGYKYKAKRAALQRVIEDGDHYFGFDNARQAFREALRNPKDFMNAYEMTAFEESVFKDFIKAKEAYNKVEGISMQDQKALKAIAESADRFSNRINKVRNEHRAEAAKYLHKYRSYTIKGGTNYRELLFRIPGSTYSNGAMNVHWERSGVLAHARMQDLDTFLGKMLFIEEIQSDWHNEGHKSGYITDADKAKVDAEIQTLEEQKANLFDKMDALDKAHDSFLEEYWASDMTEAEYDKESRWHMARSAALRSEMRKIDRKIDELIATITQAVPDAPFKDNYHEYVLKRLIRMAAEQDYDSIGWTTADIQSKRWSDQYAEGYRIEYDQDIPKFLNKYGKKWGTRVGKTVLDNGTEVWSMAITDEMKESVLTDGQVMYSLPKDSSSYKEPAYQEWDVQAALYDAMDHADESNDNLIRVGNMPKYITEKLGIEGDFYIYRNHAYENMVSREQAIKDGRPVTRKGVRIHFHDFGVDTMTEAILSLENPTMTIATKTAEGNPAVIMLLPVKGKNKAPLYAVLSFYSNRKINGDYSRRPHIVLTIAERDFFGSKGRGGYAEIVGTAVKDGRVIDYNKKTRDDLSVIANPAGVGNITDSSLSDNLARFRKEIKSFREKNHIDYKLPVGEDTSPRALLANAFEGVAQDDFERNKIREYRESIEKMNAEEQKLRELRAQIRELSFSSGPRDKVKLTALREEATETANRINIYDSQLLRLEASEPLQAVLAREKQKAYKRAEKKGKEALEAYREKAAKTQRELLTRYQDARKKAIENRYSSDVRAKIRAFKAKLEKSLLKPTDRQYVPIDLIKAMVEVCDLIDTDTELYKHDGSINVAQERRNLTKEKLQNLKDEYEKLKTHSDPIYAGEFDEMVYTYLTELRDGFSGKNLKEMTLDELRGMYEILRAIEETLQDARKLIGWGDAENVYEAGDAIISEQNQITQSRKGGKRNAAQIARDKSLNLSLSPVRNVERMSGYHEDSYLLKLFKRFEQGIRKKNKFVMDAYKAFEALTNGKEYDDAFYKEVGGKKYTDINGRRFGVSKMQMMQAVLSYEREVANNLHHIEKSGFSFADLDMLRKGNLRDAISEEYSHRVPAAVKLVAEFNEVLRDDKWCQDYMAEARKFFNGTAKEAINETSIALKHRIIAKDKNYIPFEVDKNFVVREISAENEIQQTINSYGMLKDIKKGASQPLIITGLNNILERHIDQVGNVYGLAIEVRNFNKVWNMRTLDAVGNNPTVKAIIQRNWGVEGVKHIEQAVQDIQGPRIRERNALYSKVKSNYISATFLLNLSVVTKQIGSLYSATSMLKWRGPVRQVGNLLYTMFNHKKISAEVDKYTATAWMRRQGLSDAELHTFMTEGKKTFIGKLVGKLPSVVNPGKWITAMDHAVALSLWKYAKQDTAKRTGLKGEELLKATAEFYDEVIENTQSMTDVLHRPEIQKRGDILSESLGMFKTDLYQMAGQLQTTAGRFTANKTKENGKALGRTVYAIAMSAIWAQLMTTVFALLRYKVNQYRDEDDEDLTAESWLKRQGFALAGDLMGYIFPIFGSEVVGFFENIMYGESDDIVDSIALTAINDLYDIMVNVAAGIKDGEMPKPSEMKKLTTKVLQVFGIPANNILRTLEAIHLHAKDIANGEFLSFEAGIDRSPKHHIHRIVEAMEEGRIDVAKGLFEEAVEETAMGKTDDGSYGNEELKDAESDLKTALGNKFKDGEITKTQAVDVLVKCFGIGREEAEQKVGEWVFKVEYGYAWSDRKKAYLAGDISAKELKTALMEVGGKTAEAADEYIAELDFEDEHGFAYDDRGDAYKNGEISRSELKNILMDIDGKTEDEAELQITVYDWQKEGFDIKNNATGIINGYEKCEAAGITKETYYDFYQFYNESGEEGVRNSKVTECMPYIGRLPLSDYQKDAIALSIWAASTVEKYKTW